MSTLPTSVRAHPAANAARLTPLPPAGGAYYFGLAGLFLLAYLASFVIVRPWAEFPVNDDWLFAKDCLLTVRAGHPVYTHFEAPWLIPQLIYGTLLVKVFGFSHLLLRCTGCLTMIGALVVFDLYLRRAGIRLWTRVVAWFSLAFHPFVYPQVTSFMTDVPFLLAWLGACYCWDRALEVRTTRWLVAATAATIVATAQRQFGLLVPASALLLLLIEKPLTPRVLLPFVRLPPRDFPARLTLSFVVLGLFTGTVFLLWRFYVHGFTQPLFAPRGWKIQLYLTFVTLNCAALSALPMILATRSTTRRATPAERGIGIVICVGFGAAALWFLRHGTFPLYQNVVSEFGFFGEGEVLPGRRPVIFGPMLNRLIVGAGIVAFLLIVPRFVPPCGDVVRRFAPRADPDPDNESRATHGALFGRVLMMSGAVYLLFSLYRGVSVFDRYMMPALPATLLAVARASPVDAPFVRRAAAFAVAAVFALVSTTLTHDYFRWREAAWQAAESVVRQGVPAEDIEAGYEWYGWQVGKEAFPPPDLRLYPYVVSFSALPGYESSGAVPWTSLWSPHERRIFLLRRAKPPGDPAPSAAALR